MPSNPVRRWRRKRGVWYTGSSAVEKPGATIVPMDEHGAEHLLLVSTCPADFKEYRRRRWTLKEAKAEAARWLNKRRSR